MVHRNMLQNIVDDLMLTVLEQRYVHFGRVIWGVPHLENVAHLNVLNRHEVDMIVVLVRNQILLVAKRGRRNVNHPIAFVHDGRVQINVAHFEQFAEFRYV